MYRAYVLYAGDEPIGFSVCSLEQCPAEPHRLMGEADTYAEAETLAEEAFVDALFEWGNADA